MTQAAVLYDCEFLTAPGAMSRFWCGPYDPDPFVVQIGAVRLGLEPPHAILGEIDLIVRPIDRHGRPVAIDAELTRLTGITQTTIDTKGLDLETALARLVDFSSGATLWSWGKDEVATLATSCFVAGIESPIPPDRFDNVCKLMLRAGMPYADIVKTRSNGLAAYFGVARDGLTAHDALDDARSLTDAVRHLMDAGRLTAADFDPDAGLPSLA